MVRSTHSGQLSIDGVDSLRFFRSDVASFQESSRKEDDIVELQSDLVDTWQQTLRQILIQLTQVVNLIGCGISEPAERMVELGF